MPATDIINTLIVPDGEVLTYSPSGAADTTAFWLVARSSSGLGPEDRLPLDPTLINYGEIYATNNGAAGQVFTDMITLFVGAGSFWTGVIVENHGTMSATSEMGEARAFSSSSWSPSLINTGTLIANSAQGLARTVWTYGLDQPNGPTFKSFFIYNAAGGEIIADAAQAFAVASIFANFTNDGLVRAIGGNVSGIGVRSNGGYIENNGQIIATAAPGATSWGIALGLADSANGPRNTTLINTGLISAQIAVDELYNGNVSTSVANSGVINGSIIFYDGNDSIQNNGSISGNISLGAGADYYDGQGGEFTGHLDAGDGDDTINVGNHGGSFEGGSGLDVLVVDRSDAVSSVTYAYNINGAELYVGGAAVLSFAGFERVDIAGGSGYDNIVGGDGDDVIRLGFGGGVADGGLGDDLVTADFSDRTSSVVYSHNNVESVVLVGGAPAAVIRNAERVNLVGGSANDQIAGGNGDDVLTGGGGGDALDGGDGWDTASYASSGGAVTVSLVGAVSGHDASGDVLTSIENLTGSGYNDVLTGDANANFLNGGAGDDTLIGGLGDDSYYVDSANDVVLEDAAGGNDRVYATVSIVLAANVEELQLNGSADIFGFGNELGNTIIGNTGDNLLWGGAGADLIDGGDGFDTLSYAGSTSGVNVNMATGVGDFGHAEGDQFWRIESLIGTAFQDNLVGSSSSNWIEGGAGADVINGQGGYDTASYAHSSQGVVINLLAGSSPQSSGDAEGDILLNIEGVIGSEFNDVITGNNSGSNGIEGLGGDDLIVGTYGNDRIDGGLGFDTVSYAAINRGVTVDLSRGLVSKGGEIDQLVSIEGVVGTSFGDLLTGNSAANVLDGGAGVDTMSGGLGDDSYVVDNVGDVVVELSAQGLDHVSASVSYATSANVENLTLTGVAAINGQGNSLNNVITGNSAVNELFGFGGNDTLDGGAGADRLYGGEGDDTYIVDNASDQVFEANFAWGTDTVISSVTYFLGANIDNLTLSGVAAINANGNATNNVLTGNSAANALFGLAGNDTLDGGAGADQMYGGEGDDTYIVDNTGDVSYEANAGWGTDTVLTSVSYFLTANLEHMTLTGVAAINAQGNANANILTGNSAANQLFGFNGNDWLDGGVGADQMYGGEGDDTYVVDNAFDVVFEANVAWGIDTVRSSVTWTLSSSMENLTLTGVGAVNGSGNGLNNVVTGNAAANTLFGYGGADTLDGGEGVDQMYGGEGDDFYIVDNSADVAFEGNNAWGTDTVFASASYALGGGIDNLILTGSANLNGTGNGLANVITGNSGNNTLTGGGGADTFVFASALGSGNVDTITDFNVADDTIELDVAIFTGISSGALAAEAFVIGAAAADSDDRIIYDPTTGALYYDADGDGGGAAVQFATLTTGLALTHNDFLGGP